MTLDYTLFIQLGIFLYVLFVLHFWIIRPIMKLLQRRDALTSGRADEAAGFEKQIEDLEFKIDAQISDLKNSLDEQRQETLRRNREIAESRISEARARVERQIEEQRVGLESDAAKVRAKIPTMAQSVADEIVKTILHSKVVKL
jgi:F-type H+-transporting ATPase subunit b